MSNIEHLFEAFYSEMDSEDNREMLSKVLVPVSELWEIVQYIVFNYCMFCEKRGSN